MTKEKYNNLCEKYQNYDLDDEEKEELETQILICSECGEPIKLGQEALPITDRLTGEYLFWICGRCVENLIKPIDLEDVENTSLGEI